MPIMLQIADGGIMDSTNQLRNVLKAWHPLCLNKVKVVEATKQAPQQDLQSITKKLHYHKNVLPMWTRKRGTRLGCSVLRQDLDHYFQY